MRRNSLPKAWTVLGQPARAAIFLAGGLRHLAIGLPVANGQKTTLSQLFTQDGCSLLIVIYLPGGTVSLVLVLCRVRPAQPPQKAASRAQ
jgi:hypothetical protein